MAASTKPLAGKRVVVTRAAEQAGELVHMLEDNGAQILLVPSVAFADVEDKHLLDAAILSLFRFDWLLLTSQNAVRFFSARCRERVDRSGESSPLLTIGARRRGIRATSEGCLSARRGDWRLWRRSNQWSLSGPRRDPRLCPPTAPS